MKDYEEFDGRGFGVLSFIASGIKYAIIIGILAIAFIALKDALNVL